MLSPAGPLGSAARVSWLSQLHSGRGGLPEQGRGLMRSHVVRHRARGQLSANSGALAGTHGLPEPDCRLLYTPSPLQKTESLTSSGETDTSREGRGDATKSEDNAILN